MTDAWLIAPAVLFVIGWLFIGFWIFGRKVQLAPDVCQCEHARCYHYDGLRKCNYRYQTPEMAKIGVAASCACVHFVKAGTGAGSSDSEVEQLRKIAGLPSA